MRRRIEITIPSRFEEIELIDLLSSATLGHLGFPQDDLDRAVLAVREAVANAVEHGNDFDVAKHVQIRFSLGEEALEIEVRDQGNGFDPNALPDPLAAENLLKTRGRGILLIRSFMDEVRFSFDGGAGTVVTLRKRSPGP